MAIQTRHPGLILAGGLSRRMGIDKAGLAFGMTSLVAFIAARLRPQVSALAVNTTDPLPEIEDAALIPDSLPGHLGPLAGILAGLEAMDAWAPATHLLTVPVDSPFFPSDLASRLDKAATAPETIVIAASQGRHHPVFGLWPLALAPDLRRFVLSDEKRSIRSFLARRDTCIVEFPLEDGRDPFFNINTPADLREAMSRLELDAK